MSNGGLSFENQNRLEEISARSFIYFFLYKVGNNLKDRSYILVRTTLQKYRKQHGCHISTTETSECRSKINYFNETILSFYI